MDKAKCVICGDHPTGGVICPKHEKQLICYSHCEECNYYSYVISLPRCMFLVRRVSDDGK